MGLRMRESAHAVLHDHHRAVDDDAEVQRAQAHQVRADLLVVHHAGEGEQHRQRNDQRGDQGRADVAEEQEQHGDDQHRAFEQVLLDGGDGLVDQHRPVVDGDCLDAWRQRAVDLYHLLVHRLRDRRGCSRRSA